MSEMKFLYLLVALLSVAVAASWVYILYLQNKLRHSQLESQSTQKDVVRTKEQLVEHVKSKIEATQTARLHRIKPSDIMSRYVYSQDCVREVAQDLDDIYHNEYIALREKYDQLTDLDLLILSLLANGLENHEICTLLHMERQTLYKRRQLISKRIGISSTELEKFSLRIFAQD